MKHLFEERETIITTGFFLNEGVDPEKLSNGDIVPHREAVTSVHFWIEEQDFNGQTKSTKVCLDRKYIIELADKIRQIQENVVDMPFDTLPF
jgi:hypothetical protein